MVIGMVLSTTKQQHRGGNWPFGSALRAGNGAPLGVMSAGMCAVTGVEKTRI